MAKEESHQINTRMTDTVTSEEGVVRILMQTEKEASMPRDMNRLSVSREKPVEGRTVYSSIIRISVCETRKHRRNNQEQL